MKQPLHGQEAILAPSTLRSWRLYTPGVIILLLGVLAGILSEETSFNEVAGVQKFLVLGAALILGVIYSAFGLRSYTFSPSVSKVTINIREQMLKIAGLPDDPKYKWSTARDVFYKLVDNDSSLSIRSRNIMNNGAIMSSLADAAILSYIAAILTIFAAMARISVPPMLGFIYFGIVFLATALQTLVERRHVRMSQEQIDFMALHYKEQIRTALQNAV